MQPPSSDGLEILSHAFPRPARPPTRSEREGSTGRGRTPGLLAPVRGASEGAGKLPDVIELLSESDDDVGAAGGAAADSDDGIVIVEASREPAGQAKAAFTHPSSAASDDLPTPSAAWALGSARTSNAMRRSASMMVGTSASAGLASTALARAKTLPILHEIDDLPASAFSYNFTSSPALPQPAPAAAAPDPKGKRRALFEPEDFAMEDDDVAETQLAEDPWADILGEPTPAKGKGKKKADEKGGKKKDEVVAGKKPKKRLFNAESGSEGETASAPKRTAQAKAPRPSAPPVGKQKSGPPPLVATLSKTALKKQETAERMKLREANTLRAGDKKVSTAELTLHVSGTAFAGSDEEDDSDDMYAVASAASKKKGKGKKKASPWLEISKELQERLKLYDCDVECPERPRKDVGCEGAVRWTRLCDRMWDEGKKVFLPLADREKIVVEEDSRLVFLTAHDLSRHIASNSLSAHIADIQSRLPSHVNLFILLYGLPSLFRELEKAKQESYRNSVRAAAGEDEPTRPVKAKLPGIGENQPSKDDLELELMRVQVKSRCMIVSVDKVSEAVDWLEQITFDVGQKPYQRLKHSHVALLGTSEDKVPSGKDLQDTYIKMLASLPRVTEAVAKGIVAEYPTMRELYESWERCADERERKDMLVGIGKGRNVNGTTTHRMIGQALSSSIYKIMTSRDPSMFL